MYPERWRQKCFRRRVSDGRDVQSRKRRIQGQEKGVLPEKCETREKGDLNRRSRSWGSSVAKALEDGGSSRKVALRSGAVEAVEGVAGGGRGENDLVAVIGDGDGVGDAEPIGVGEV